MQKLRVLWFSNTPANADEYYNKEAVGSGVWLRTLDSELQRVVDLHVAFISKNNKEFIHKESSYHPICISDTLFQKIIKRGINYPRTDACVRKCLNIIDDVKPDIIHIHGTESTFGEIIGKTRHPIVISIQGNITVYRHKYFSGIEERYIKRLWEKNGFIKSVVFGNPFRIVRRSFNSQYKHELRYLSKCEHIIGRTAWDRRVSSMLAPKSRYFQNDEILRDSFYTNEWVPKDRGRTIIHTTTGGAIYKGLETVGYALNILNNRGCDVEWRVAGISENDLIVRAIKRKLGQNYPRKRLIYLGKLNADQLLQKMLEANIYVMPSHIENSPNSLCEAMIMGMPCISTFVGGTGSILQDGEDGILIQDGDPWAMAGAVAELIRNESLASIYGCRARKKALIRHSKETVVRELVLIYKKIINMEQKLLT